MPSGLREDLQHRQTGPTSIGAAACPQLTRRKFEVGERRLRAWSFDAVAVALGVSATTVKTCRNHVFERLGIRHRHELFAPVVQFTEASSAERARGPKRW